MSDKAILFGVNNYKSISGLKGCVNDLEDVRRLLIDAYKFDDGNIRVYSNEQVIRDTVEREFAWLATDTGPGDRVVFHFSGHGSFTTSKSADKDIDELLCLYDMDWKDEGSFLRDTDLGALTRRINTGARLTVILDSCHSGTGTRAFTTNLRSLARATSSKSPLVIVADSANRVALQRNIADPQSLARGIDRAQAAAMTQLQSEDTPPVLARFVAPPANIQNAIATRTSARVRAVGQSVRDTLNHQLLAAADEKQTAADAFIDGQYRGAFSFTLCSTARLDPTKSFGDIMQLTKQRIKQQGFSQDPQIEGPFTQEALFGSASFTTNVTPDPMPSAPSTAAPDSNTTACTGCSADTPNENAKSGGDAAEPTSALATLNRWLNVSEKLIDLAASQMASRAAPAATLTARDATGSEVIVYVHGISEHLPGYSLIWHQALAPHLSRPIRTAEVRWSQLVNARAVDSPIDPVRAVEAESLQAEIEVELERRTRRMEAMAQQRNRSSSGAQTRELIAMERSRSFLIDDFSRYMLFESTREAILNEFFKIVVPELEAGNKVHIVSHSWGTVVAYEGLRRLDNRTLPGHVANLFTAGSALSISLVQSNLFGRVVDGRSPVCTRRIVNLDAGGDAVGGPIGGAFTVDREFLGLDPTGCRKIPFTGLAFNPACAHRSYFLKDNLAVNRDIFAAYINS